jgi:hypothetical protein
MALTVRVQAQSFLTNGLVAYYPLNGNANDASGNGNNGTVVGAIPATDRFGNPNGCYSFNGIAQYIYAAAGSLPSGQRTISLWFKLNEVNIHPVLLGYGRSCGSSYWMGLNLAEKAAFTVGTHCGGYELDVPYNVPPTNSWKQWVVVMSTNQTIFYLNGNLLGSEAGSPTTAVAGTQLGLGVATGNGDSGTVPYTDSNLGYLDGYLDDVRIYNRPLSTNEVAQLYAIESSPIINIQKAVYLTVTNLWLGSNYQLQASSNLINWTNQGSVFTATTNYWRSTNYWDVANWSQLYFRLQVAP